MKLHRFLLVAFVFAITLKPMTAQDRSSAKVSQFASGFNNPRGLKFGSDGYLYVAEGGTASRTPKIAQSSGAVNLNTETFVIEGY